MRRDPDRLVDDDQIVVVVDDRHPRDGLGDDLDGPARCNRRKDDLQHVTSGGPGRLRAHPLVEGDHPVGG